ncbi:ankyrin [Ophiobolus disseminans]|uniref:Ankyrin n=1 Tax=Ophiobolus disseminans TaxID=1469910 RepID=A0A6A6ZHU3_9PLEO|nr:ankyrin [Ophiobolus disseminans]
MVPILLKNGPNYLTYAAYPSGKDATFAAYADACASNNITSAPSLSPGLKNSDVTFGLNIAVQQGHLELVRQLLNAGAKWDANTIIYAARSFDAVKLLVGCGYDVNTGLIGGGALLPMAVGHNNEAGIRYLLERGAKPSFGPKRNAPGHITEWRAVMESRSILNKAARACSPAIFALLLSYGSDLSHHDAIPLHSAAGCPPSQDGNSRIPMLEYLVDELGIDVNALDTAIEIAPDGRGQTGTPLHYAIKFGNVEIVKWLLNKGTDPDKKLPWGRSARELVNRVPPGHAICALFAELEAKT